MRSSSSLPSLFTESRLFVSHQQLETSKNDFRTRINSDTNKNQQQDKRPSRPLIHFADDAEGFTSFRSINTSKMEEILSSLKVMKTNSTNMDRTTKAEILFNKNQYSKITDYCNKRSKNQIETVISQLAKLEPIEMKKKVKTTQKYQKTTKTLVAVKLNINWPIFQTNKLSWKPFVDFDAMSVNVLSKTYFIAGRKTTPLCYYDHSQNKWIQQQQIAGLKPFGQSEGTVISEKEIMFFGGSKFFQVGESETNNNLTILNLSYKTAQTKSFAESEVSSRCFHAQCRYGDYLIVSGGIDKKHKSIDNFMAYNIVKKYWVQITIQKLHEELKAGFAKHKMMTVVHQRKKYHLYEEEPITADQTQQAYISQEGIYLFGGENGNGKLSNRLFILKIGITNLEAYEPKTKGKQPEPRKSFDWLRIRQLLFIHGGKNDQVSPWVLQSMNVLNLKTMNWIKVKGENLVGRYMHSLVNYQNEIVIVGGKNMEGLCKQVLPISYQEIVEYI